MAPYLAAAMQVNRSNLAKALEYFRTWANDRGLRPSETAYVARTSDRRALRFSESGAPDLERGYPIHCLADEAARVRRRERDGVRRAEQDHELSVETADAILRIYPGCPEGRAQDTAYDELLMAGVERAGARQRVSAEVQRVHESWQ